VVPLAVLGGTAFAIGEYDCGAALSQCTDELSWLLTLAPHLVASALPAVICQAQSSNTKTLFSVFRPTFVAALGDLYKLAGEREAAARYALVERMDISAQ